MTQLWHFYSSSWRCAALLSFTTFATPAAPPTNKPRTFNNGRIDRIPPCFAIGSIICFTFFFFVFKSMPIFVLAFIAAQRVTTVALSPRVFRDFRGEYFVCHMSFNENVAMWIGYIVLATLRVQRINTSITIPLANHFSTKCVPGSQNLYPVICNSKGRAFIARFNKLDIHCNSLSKNPNCWYAFNHGKL